MNSSIRTRSMKGEEKYYILRTERPCKIEPSNLSQTVVRKVAEKSMSSELCYSGKKGDIFKDSTATSQPEDVYKIHVLSVENKEKSLEANTDDLIEISKEVAMLLLPVENPEKRYDLLKKRNFIEEALAKKKGDQVWMDYTGSMRTGKVKMVGTRPGKVGTFFEIDLEIEEFIHRKKDSYKSISHVNEVTTVDKLTFLPPSNNDLNLGSKPSNSKTRGSNKMEKHDKFGKFKCGMEVTLFMKDKPLKGTIKFIGKAAGEDEMSFGIELNEPHGNSDGMYHGERVMKCKRNHGIFAKESEIIDSKLYNGEDSSSYVHITYPEASEGKRVAEMVNHSESDKTATRYSSKSRTPLENSEVQSSSKAGYNNYDSSVNVNGSRKPTFATEMHSLNENSVTHPYSGSYSRYPYTHGQNPSQTNLAQKERGPSSMPFDNDHYGNDKYKTSTMGDFHPSSAKLPRKGSDTALDYLSMKEGHSKIERKKPGNYDPSLQVDSVVQVSINDVPRYGVIKWIGHLDDVQLADALIAGLELEEPSLDCGDGSLKGKRYFTCLNGRGFFIKLSKCKKDERFISHVAPSALLVNQSVEEIPGNFLPPDKFENAKSGRMQGIQGHHNSCYLDSTLFAMFAFSMVFDSVLYRRRRRNDIEEYEQVQNVLKNAIVNPLRLKGFVNAASVLQLRRWMDKLANVPGFMNEEKDPEEFLMLLLKDVLRVEPFLKIRTNKDELDESYFYQILVDREESNPLPTLQYLFELSFLTGSFCLEEVPSVLVIQLPRSGLQKIYRRIRISPTLDVSNVMTYASTFCFVCGKVAEYNCKECRFSFGWEHPFVYFCPSCKDLFHQNSSRISHKVDRINAKARPVGFQECTQLKELELFAVVCIQTSHYVTFAKCGSAPDDRWLFFDSMADRVGEETGHNVPEIVECPEIKEWFDKSPLTFTESDSKNTPEKVLRLFEDASLCFYRSSGLSMYK